VSDAGSPADDIVDALAARDAGAALLAVDAAVRAGRDPRVLADALVASLREAFLVAMGVAAGGLSDQAAARAAEVAQALGPATLTRGLEAVGTALVDMRQAPDPRIPLEVALVRLTRPETADDLSALVSRVEQLERAVATGIPAAPPAEGDVPTTGPTAAPAAAPDAAPAPAEAPTAAAPATATPAPSGQPRGADAARARLAQQHATGAPPPEPATAPPTGSRPTLGGVRRARAEGEPGAPADTAPEPVQAAPEETTAPPAASAGSLPDDAELTAAWPTVLEALKPRAKALYKPGRFVPGNGSVARFALPNEAHRDRCADKRDEVAEALTTHFGRPVPLELAVDDTAAPAASPASTSVAAATPDEDVDLDELTDAPDASVGGIAQLKDAFPGAELLEDQ
jgi:DNA polymerase-3 subunit gamma/tau